jgi:cell fate regulator YaaT (PSP1 superfamily)
MTDEPPDDDGPDDGPDNAPEAAGDAAAPEGQRRKRRRRRRRRDDRPNGGQAEGARPASGPADAGRERPSGGPPDAGGRERRQYDQVHGRPAATPPDAAGAADVDGGWTDAAPGDAPRADAGSSGADPGRGAADRGAADRGADTDRGRSRADADRGRRRGGRADVGRGGGRGDTSRGGGRADAGRGGDAGRGDADRGSGARADADRGSGARADADGGGGARADADGGGGRGDAGRGGGRAEADRGGGRGDAARGRADADRSGRGDPGRGGRGDARGDAGGRGEPAHAPAPAMPRLEQHRKSAERSAVDDPDEPPTDTSGVPWGTDDDSPPPVIVLAPDLPADPPRDDDDPLTHPLLEAPAGPPGDDIVGACGVRFVPGGRISWFDCGDADWAVGDRVLVDGERGQRLGWIASPPVRRVAPRDRLRRVVRRANEHDLRGERDTDADRARALRIAKDRVAALRLPMKVFRVELIGQLGRGAKLNVYYTSDERIDLRDFIREVGGELAARIELRQLGVRDEAKAVGGIGSCGLTLCCTTWLPDFVPVSIKMAKDQGLVLSPTKVSGQCGRLKCCLVYEQAAYAELRKGLPKLGKRVIGVRGEGRVVEVDVLRQRVRVSYGPGDTEVVPAAEVKPLFPSGNQPRAQRPEPEHDDDSLETDDPSALAKLRPEPSPILDEPRPPAEPDEPAPEHDAFADLADLPDADPSRDPNADD